MCEFGLLADPQPGVDRAQAVAIDRMLGGQADLRKSFTQRSTVSVFILFTLQKLAGAEKPAKTLAISRAFNRIQSKINISLRINSPRDEGSLVSNRSSRRSVTVQVVTLIIIQALRSSGSLAFVDWP